MAQSIQRIHDTDRTLLLPPHSGANVLPNSPFFSKLLRHAHRKRLAIRDVLLGVEKTYGDLLSDVLQYRQVVEQSLGQQLLKQLKDGHEVYIGVLAAGGYEFTVAALTVIALGAVLVPMAASVPVEEAAYFVFKSKQVAMLAGSPVSKLARSIAQFVASKGTDLKVVDILLNRNQQPRIAIGDILISSDQFLDDNAPGVVIFTSGTTGPPKGVVMRRAYIHEAALAISDGYDITSDDRILHVLPVHHTTGLATSFFAYIVNGAAIEFRSSSFDPQWVWDRWAEGGLTIFSGVPTIFIRLQRHFEEHISKKNPQELDKYIQGARQLRIMKCGSSALQDTVQRFWTELRNGVPILTRYGMTEVPGCIKMSFGNDAGNAPKGCVGIGVPGVELRLSDGDNGELLVRSPHMFSRYISDDEATIGAHTPDGYFKTGDIGRREGPYFFITGRMSVDIIKSGGYKISTLDIERECLELPYVSEAAVVGVDDDEFGQRVGAILSLKSSHKLAALGLTIQKLRDDLREKLTAYKLPTLLRVVDGELPKGGTGKVQKKVIGPQLLPAQSWSTTPEVQAWSPRTRRSNIAAVARL